MRLHLANPPGWRFYLCFAVAVLPLLWEAGNDTPNWVSWVLIPPALVALAWLARLFLSVRMHEEWLSQAWRWLLLPVLVGLVALLATSGLPADFHNTLNDL